jgi:hypothetical protein
LEVSVATGFIELNSATWTKISSGESIVAQVRGLRYGGVLFFVGSVVSDDVLDSFIITDSFAYDGGESVFAKLSSSQPRGLVCGVTVERKR